jgi:hypothetical protein
VGCFEKIWPLALYTIGDSPAFITLALLCRANIIMYNPLRLVLLAATVSSFGWVPAHQGIDRHALRDLHPHNKRQQASCPYNAKHEPAAAYNPKYPYTGARNGLPGTGKGGIKVPADEDKAHEFRAPTANDIRGPCPGMNTAANVR